MHLQYPPLVKDAPDVFYRQFDSWAFGPVNDYRDLWFNRKKDRREMIFHDPLAAACVFEEDLCTYETGDVSVDLKGERFFAATSFQAGGGARRIAVEVDSERFFRHFFDVLRHAAPGGG
jgi:purine nucleosidase